MRIVKTLCDSCGKEMPIKQENAIEFNLTVKQCTATGDRQKIIGHITVTDFDVCNNCIFNAIALEHERATVGY